MHYIFAAIAVLLPLVGYAGEPQFNLETAPYAVVSLQPQIDAAPVTYFGKLGGFPDTYEWQVRATTTFSVLVSALAQPEPAQFSGILVREVKRNGVAEVARLGVREGEVVTDSDTGLRFVEGGRYTGQLGPGTYRFEVSNPENTGAYRVTFAAGTNVPEDMFNRAQVQKIYMFFGLPTWQIWLIPRFYSPLVIVLVVGVPLGLWWYRRRYVHR